MALSVILGEIGLDLGTFIGKNLKIKGKFEKHDKFFYRESTENNAKQKDQLFLINSGMKVSISQADGLFANWKQYCKKCISVNFKKENCMWFHVEEGDGRGTAQITNFNGQEYDKRYMNPGHLPPGIPQSDATKIFVSQADKYQSAQNNYNLGNGDNTKETLLGTNTNTNVTGKSSFIGNGDVLKTSTKPVTSNVLSGINTNMIIYLAIGVGALFMLRKK